MTLDQATVSCIRVEWEWIEIERGVRRYRASMPGPFDGQILSQTKFVNMNAIRDSYLGPTQQIEMMKHDVEQNLLMWHEQLKSDPNALVRYRQSMRGTRGTL